MLADIGELDLFLTTAVENYLLYLRRESLKWRVDVKVVVAGERLKETEDKGISSFPAGDCTGSKSQCRITNHPFRIEELANPETFTVWTGSGWIIEREEPGLGLAETVTTFWTGKAG